MSVKIFNRYVWLLDLVASHDGISYDDISDAWEQSGLNDRPGEPLPKRTLHNHIQAIEDMFDIKIECLRQAGYPYVLRNKDNGNLSQSQQALITQLRLTSAMTSSSKLKGRIVMGRRIMYKIITPILSAMEAELAVKITTSGRIHPDNQMRRREVVTFEPYFIKQFNHWFVVGRVVEDGKIHAFSFSSILHISQQDQAYSIPEGFDVEYYLLDPPYSSFENGIVDDSAQLIFERSNDRYLYDEAFRDLDNNVNLPLVNLRNSPNTEYANYQLTWQSVADEYAKSKM